MLQVHAIEQRARDKLPRCVASLQRINRVGIKGLPGFRDDVRYASRERVRLAITEQQFPESASLPVIEHILVAVVLLIVSKVWLFVPVPFCRCPSTWLHLLLSIFHVCGFLLMCFAGCMRVFPNIACVDSTLYLVACNRR